MRVRLIAMVMLVVAPTVAAGQRGGKSSAGSGRDPLKPPPAGARLSSARDYEEMNPASLLVEKRKKLSLPDSTVARLKTLEKSIKERNKVALTMYDSVRKRIVQSGDAAASDVQIEAQQNRLGLRNLITQLREQRRTDAADVLALVPVAQRDEASALLKAQDDEFDRLSSRSGSGGQEQ